MNRSKCLPRGSYRMRKSASWKNGSGWDRPIREPIPRRAGPPEPIVDAVRSHWSFQPIIDRPPPRVKNDAWPRSGVDRFVLAKLESKGLSPVDDADKLALLRRVFFDLVGVPPNAGRDRVVSRGRQPRRVCENRRWAPGPPRIWSTMGPSLAGCGALCRLQRLVRELHLLRRLAFSQLRDCRLQRRQAGRPVSQGTVGRRPVAVL